MLSVKQSKEALQKLFRQLWVVDINALYKTLETDSRMSVFRRLRDLEYMSSYTHAGGYYTLLEIPQFDDNGLWFHQEIGFSRLGTLRATIIEIANTSECGVTQSWLHHLLRIRVQDTLLSLVRAGQIGREKVHSKYLYVSGDAQRAGKQLAQYQIRAQRPEPLPIVTVVEVLVETLRAYPMHISTSTISARLTSRGIDVPIDQVDQVFTQYGIDTEKKTPD